MAASVTVGRESITIELSGLNSLSARRRVLEIPLAAITAIRDGGRVPSLPTRGVSASLTGMRSGALERNGKSVFFAFRPGHPTISLDLDRATFPELPYDTVVLSLDRSAPGDPPTETPGR